MSFWHVIAPTWLFGFAMGGILMDYLHTRRMK
jgi:hypothetical protein